MVAADDEVRDYGNAEKAEGLREKWESRGCHVISMANDWKTIYGEDVAKTGEFHQPEVPAPVIVTVLNPVSGWGLPYCPV